MVIRLFAVFAIVVNSLLIYLAVQLFGISVFTAVFLVAWLSAAFAVLGRPKFRVMVTAVILSTIVPVLVLEIAAARANNWWSNGAMRPDAFAVASLVPERELAIAGAVAMAGTGRLGATDELSGELRAQYDAMAADVLWTPSPFLNPLLAAPDGLRFGPPAADKVVVFLHGYGGNFALPCWMFGRAVTEAGFATVCPTLDYEARWDLAGERVAETVDAVRREGAQIVVLAGLSNGAVGAAEVARKVDVDGVVLISGLGEGQIPIGKSTLVVCGDRDPVVPAARLRSYRGSAVDTMTLKGGHFVFVERYPEVAKRIEAFARTVGNGTGSR